MKKIIVACSGGPDSMALLDMCVKQSYEICVAHVNYQKRKTALRDEELLRLYCKQHDVRFRVLYPQWDHKKNFQAWARDVRYAFFESCADDFGTKDIYVAHQLDDCIETYIFQKERKSVPEVYGMKESSLRHGYRIVRPLLSYEKEELEQYCIDHHVPYGIDESNLTDDYTRNRIRHHQTNHLHKEEKLRMVQSIEKENEALEQRRQEARMFLKDFRVSELVVHKDAVFIFELYFYEHTNIHLSHHHIESLLKQIKADCLIELDGYLLESFHNRLYLCEKKSPFFKEYSKIVYENTEYYKICEQGKKIESLYVQESDFPIIVRCAKEGDEIQMRFGTKKVSRFFVDRKIPRHLRSHWLVVENAQGTVIFVQGLGCDVKHYSAKPNVFVIQCLA